MTTKATVPAICWNHDSTPIALWTPREVLPSSAVGEAKTASLGLRLYSTLKHESTILAGDAELVIQPLEDWSIERIWELRHIIITYFKIIVA